MEKEVICKKSHRLFVDMDGTLAVFTPVPELERLYEKGYFLNLEANKNVVAAIKNIVKNNQEIEVNILSSVLSDSKYALKEKNQWLDTYLPEIDLSHRFFPTYGVEKRECIPGGVKDTDVLLDDYTKNLLEWSKEAKGIKLLNGINHTKGTWQYECVKYDDEPGTLQESIIEIIKKQGNLKFTLPRRVDIGLER